MNKFFKWLVIIIFALRTFFSLVDLFEYAGTEYSTYYLGDFVAYALLMVYFYKREGSSE